MDEITTETADNAIRRVVILGGGTAGWMTAAYLGKMLPPTVSITVLEAPTIPKIGVGEATVPSLQPLFFDQLGIPEEEWMPECNAAFKMAVRFVNWRTPGGPHPVPQPLDGGTDHFYHSFGVLPYCDDTPLSHYWVYDRLAGRSTEPYGHACMREVPAMDALRAPRWLDGTRATSYAWHFDAHLVADFLRRFATTKQGVRHVQDEMTSVDLDERGFITGLRTRASGTLTADLFVDCSGFRGLLINEALGEPFLDMSDHLLCDSAVATAVPSDSATQGVEPFTSSIAMPSGWTWRIPMLDRFGTGYVYASRFADRDQATRDFCALWNLDPERATLNHIRFRVGRNRRAWVRNCVAIGLSSCFLEPLESTGIYFITTAISRLVAHFPDRRFDETGIDQFNREIEFMFDNSRDFIQAHFYFSPRTDTPFWRANKQLRLTDNIQEKIATYRAGGVINAPDLTAKQALMGIDVNTDVWTNGSYYCVLAGLGVLPDQPLPGLADRPASLTKAARMFQEVKQQQRELVDTLPSNHEFLRVLHGR
ncbi:tryptophan halogenase family protein [Goodfellowiella coeruleoviolacea]|uniref:Tryptophan halogenase n=1 Tax=Goodfellowiella coeruleoviolacea TaxID=334858 RepID=A0AAE3GBK1_9PSEU|nr:tryptophan halogenase family protein [Goodfellowiella coeruleoviolacea]MCP2165281.1 tryptophan halogenase [Goodfellowiella coeruleoviolacea]